ncbi:MAG: endolytic transglycosylase MltG [Lachnospiraceae bacterium]|nr:endolytic transglycosylase MltG [Lachnospiraceae bacterium]
MSTKSTKNKKNTNKVVFRFVSISFSILIVLVVFIGVFKATTYCYDFGYRIFTEAPVEKYPGNDMAVQINEGDSAFDIGKQLEEKGLIRDSKLYVAQYYLSAYKDKILSGTYTLNTSMTAKEMMDVMSTPVEELEVENE